MNLEESDEYVEKLEKENKKKKVVLVIMAICAVILVFLIVMMQYYKSIDAKTLKMYVDDQNINFSQNFMMEDGDKKYFNIKSLCSMLGYTYHQGEYKSYTEDTEMCYVTNEYKISSFGKNSNYIIKYLINNEGTKETEETTETTEENNVVVKSQNETESKIKLINEVACTELGIYVSLEDAENIFDIQIDASSQYRIYFKTSEALCKTLANQLSNGSYKSISNYYENLMAISDDMAVVSNGEKWGVISLKSGSEIIGMKYDDIIYMQSSNEFLVKAGDYCGLISITGKTIVKPTTYENITPMCDIIRNKEDDEDDEYIEKLYIVEQNDKYGVINNSGDVIIFQEYSSIGIENVESFSDDNIKNGNILLDSLIPVKRDDKYGLIDINGNEVISCVYDSLGYIADANATGENQGQENNSGDTSNTFNNLLLIPEEIGIKGIIVKRDGFYGIFDLNGGSLTVPCVFSKIYAKTKLSTKKYYFEYNGEEIEIKEYIENNGLNFFE